MRAIAFLRTGENMKKALAAVALMGITGTASATPATLLSVTSYSKNGTTTWNIGGSTAIWDVNTGTGVATQLSGTYKGVAKVGVTPLMTHTMTGAVLSSGTASATSWSCTEGIFGGIVGAHICGNYSFGGNATNDSVYNPTATGATVAIGGDDVALPGGPQTLANSYSGMLMTVNSNGLKLSNGVVGVSGYTFCFGTGETSGTCAVTPIPAAAWLFGSAFGLMGLLRRKISR
jgi:hypothetical protein